MIEFKKLIEELDTAQSDDDEANKGVTAILLEGDLGCGKMILLEAFCKFLGKDTEYIYTECNEETNTDRLIETYNIAAIIKGNTDKAIEEGVLTKSINLANAEKKVVLTIDNLDKAREDLDLCILDFLQNRKIKTSNGILALTEEGRKNLYIIITKNNHRKLLDELLSGCSVIKLPLLQHELTHKTLARRFENTERNSCKKNS